MLLGGIIISASCRKPCALADQNCEHSSVSIGNMTNDTIFYGLGSNQLTDTLLAGQSITIAAGRVRVEYDKKCEQTVYSSSTYYINTNTGGWYFHVRHCNAKKNFRYDDVGGTKLFEESEE